MSEHLKDPKYTLVPRGVKQTDIYIYIYTVVASSDFRRRYLFLI